MEAQGPLQVMELISAACSPAQPSLPAAGPSLTSTTHEDGKSSSSMGEAKVDTGVHGGTAVDARWLQLAASRMADYASEPNYRSTLSQQELRATTDLLCAACAALCRAEARAMGSGGAGPGSGNGASGGAGAGLAAPQHISCAELATTLWSLATLRGAEGSPAAADGTGVAGTVEVGGLQARGRRTLGFTSPGGEPFCVACMACGLHLPTPADPFSPGKALFISLSTQLMEAVTLWADAAVTGGQRALASQDIRDLVSLLWSWAALLDYGRKWDAGQEASSSNRGSSKQLGMAAVGKGQAAPHLVSTGLVVSFHASAWRAVPARTRISLGARGLKSGLRRKLQESGLPLRVGDTGWADP